MTTQIIKQPDGKFCLFSTVSDAIIALDMTGNEVERYFVDIATEQAISHVKHILSSLDAKGKPYYQFTISVAEAAELHEEHGGKDKEFNSAVAKLKKKGKK